VRRALVTGALGFIGRHFCQALDDAGYEIIGIDIADGIDARDYFRLGHDSFTLVIHAAAVVGGRALIDGPPLALASNLELDAGLFQWAERVRPRRVVYFSSPAAYPVVLQTSGYQHALHESNINLRYPQMPDELYGWAKLTGEMLAGRARASGVRVSMCRPFSGYAEDQGEDYPFCALAGRAARREDPFVVWGSGDQARDFIHVDDIVAAVMTMVDQGIDGPVNLGTGRATTMTELARMFCAQAGYEPAIQPLPDAPSGVAYRVADVTAMSEFYVPKITVEEGVARAMRQLAAV